MFDLIIKNGLVVDGSGEKGVNADLAIKDGKIAQIAPSITGEAGQVIDAKGRIVTPGFIDNHSHSDGQFLFGTSGFNYIEQGITTECAGMCGSHPVPVYENTFVRMNGIVSKEQIDWATDICKDFKTFTNHVSKMDLPTNMAFYVGHGAIRGKVVGTSSEKPTKAQMEEMKAWVKEAMECGYVGITTGLIYPPSVYGDEEEITELCKVVAEYKGNYCSHIRGESDTVIEATDECIRIGEKSGCDVLISHMKVAGKQNLGKSKETLKLIEDARQRGMTVHADQYPFLGCSTALISALPPEFAVDGILAYVEKLKDKDFRKEVTARINANNYTSGENFIYNSGFAGCLILGAPFTPELVGKNLQEVADARGMDPFETTYDVIIENEGNVSMAYFMLNEDDMMAIMPKPYVTAGTDASHLREKHGPDHVGGAHPRGLSTFPKHLRLVRENKMMSMEKAIHRVTGMAAEICKLPNIGLLKEGYNADVLVLDWENLGETNDFIHPFKPNTGIETVVINGKVVLEKGVANGVLAGKYIKKK